MPIPSDDYWDARQAYIAAGHKYVAIREEYRRAWGAAYLASQQKTHDSRKAEADTKTTDLRLARDQAELNAAVDWQDLLVARGPMDQSRTPGQHFGQEE